MIHPDNLLLIHAAINAANAGDLAQVEAGLDLIAANKNLTDDERWRMGAMLADLCQVCDTINTARFNLDG